MLLPNMAAGVYDYRPLEEDAICRLGGGSAALGRVGLGEVLVVLLLWTMDRLLKDGLGLVDLELGLEV